MIDTFRGWYRRTDDWLVGQAGSRFRLHIVLVLAAVLALDAADKGALSVTAAQLQDYFHISKTQFGILGSITTAVGALATLPFGMYVDRVVRTRLLARTIMLWAVAMVVSGLAINYEFLLGTRVVLGIITAVAYPTVASLIGDYFPVQERGRIYGMVLSGELLGTGVGVMLSGGAASLFHSWRAAQIVLVLPALAVIWAVMRLPDPSRSSAPDKKAPKPAGAEPDSLLLGELHSRNVQPRPELVLHTNPVAMPLLQVVRYVLRIPTNVILIAASALGYFFFSGIRFFVVQYTEQHYGLGRSAASALVLVLGGGALIGVVAGGRLADAWLRRGKLNARIIIPAITFAATAIIIAPGIYTRSIGLAIFLFFVGAMFFSASNPPLDAGRLDVMLPRLWGRAESTRLVVRGMLEAVAPVSFGLVADNVFHHGSNDLEYTFLLMLVPLLIASGVLLLATRTYGRDVATAAASKQAIDKAEGL